MCRNFNIQITKIISYESTTDEIKLPTFKNNN